MKQGIILGLLANICFAIGFFLIGQATGVRNSLVKSALAIIIAAVPCLLYLLVFRQQIDWGTATNSHWLKLTLGAVIVFVAGEMFFIAGVDKSSHRVLAYTALAFPLFAVTLDVALKRSTFVLSDLFGFGLLVAGFLVILTGRGSH